MLAPGDVARQMIAGNEDIIVSQAEIDALRAELGLDKPFFFQYLDWLGRALHGNLDFTFLQGHSTGVRIVDGQDINLFERNCAIPVFFVSNH